jgi:hypothetical protein
LQVTSLLQSEAELLRKLKTVLSELDHARRAAPLPAVSHGPPSAVGVQSEAYYGGP